MNFKQMILMAVSISLMAVLPSLMGQDVQWRGPARDGIYPDTGLLKVWPEGGPGLILKKEGLGSGYSTPVLYDGDLFITGKRDSLDVLTRLDLEGNVQWETVYGMAWNRSYQETRNTPTIENGYVYITGGLGSVVCLAAGSGEIIWKANPHEEFDAAFHRWGMAESLLLTEDAVISSSTGKGATAVALDKKDGSLLWKAPSRGAIRAYASPLLVNHNGTGMLLITSSRELMALDPLTGEIYWAFDLFEGLTDEEGSRININTPLYHQGEIYVTSGYNSSAVMLTLSADGKQVKLKWANDTLDNHHGGVVLVDGYIYGSNWLSNGQGNWVCQEWETGNIMYETKWYNKGSVIYADGRLYILEEKTGHVGLLKPDPEKFNLVSSFKLEGGSGPCWAHMSIYDKKLLIRRGKVLFVYDISNRAV